MESNEANVPTRDKALLVGLLVDCRNQAAKAQGEVLLVARSMGLVTRFVSRVSPALRVAEGT
jgi:hypothetical protein